MGQIRRSSFKSAPKGKGRHGELLSGTRIQLALAGALQNGPLPSHYLRALWHSQSSAIDAITFLVQEGIIRVPAEAPHVIGRKHVYELNPTKGVEFLKLHGAYTGLNKQGNGQYKHNHMAAVGEYLFNVLPEGVTRTDIDTSMRSFHISPDGPFREYRLKYGFILAPEYDRGTEQLRGLTRETIETKVREYTTFLKARGYAQFGMRNCAIAFITMAEGRAENILEVIDEVADTEKDHFIVRHLPDFLHYEETYPDPTDFLLTTDWKQTGSRSLNIFNILKGNQNANRPQDPTAAERAA